MTESYKSALDAILMGCDRGNMAMNEWRSWRAQSPDRPMVDCFNWILAGELHNYNETLATDEQISFDVKNPEFTFFAEQMDMYTLDITIIASALTQLVDEGTVDESAKQYIEVALKRQSHPEARVHSQEIIDSIRKAIFAE